MLNDTQIKELITLHNMITPFCLSQQRLNNGKKCISWGLSSFGYDVTLSPEVLWFNQTKYLNDGFYYYDVKTTPKEYFKPLPLNETANGTCVLVPGHSLVLASTNEYFKMPCNIVGHMTVKSTWARGGMIQPPTILEPGWEGNITIEIFNTHPIPLALYINEGIAQVVFSEGDTPEVDYGTRNGKYQGQKGVTQAII